MERILTISYEEYQGMKNELNELRQYREDNRIELYIETSHDIHIGHFCHKSYTYDHYNLKIGNKLDKDLIDGLGLDRVKNQTDSHIKYIEEIKIECRKLDDAKSTNDVLRRSLKYSYRDIRDVIKEIPFFIKWLYKIDYKSIEIIGEELEKIKE